MITDTQSPALIESMVRIMPLSWATQRRGSTRRGRVGGGESVVELRCH